jgi:hypothetical protein
VLPFGGGGWRGHENAKNSKGREKGLRFVVHHIFDLVEF